MAKAGIKWRVDSEGDRHASVNGIDLTIYKARSNGRWIFALTACKDGVDLLNEISLRWTRFQHCVARAESVLNRMMEADMNTRDKLFHIMRSLATSAACGSAYEGWTDDFARKEVREVWRDESSPLRRHLGWKFTADDILSLPDEDRRALGFTMWSDGLPLRLIPLWLINYIKDGESVVCIDGKRTTKSDKLDLDVRQGCIAYGFLPA